MYGLETQSMDDQASLPAPIGVPFTGEVISPFEDAFSPLPTVAPTSHSVTEPAAASQPEGSPQQYWNRPGARQSTLFSFDPLSLADGCDTSLQSSSVTTPDKQKPPPIPPSRRYPMLPAKEKNSAVRESISYDTPRIPSIPAVSRCC